MILTKILKFQKLIGTVKRTFVKKVRTDTVLKFYRTMIIPTLVYGSDIWNLTKQQERRMEAAEMKLLRPLAGYTLLDHKQNKYIRQELGIANIIDVTHNYINRWHEHVERMSSDRVQENCTTILFSLLSFDISGLSWQWLVCNPLLKLGLLEGGCPDDIEEKKKLVGSLTEKKLPTERCTGRNGEREKSSRRKKSDDRRH
ncbi:hypothetical protein ANN_19416 [Periplaneta americana]|uniref:Endonuclease-reverse transcriptase n=1 Tax=Periplaneta americana TaxID=6978 RepID=A0ABQ8SA14_PERAM|nr:hypothetical protein ANN_19416 [Periplaneta americana]